MIIRKNIYPILLFFIIVIAAFFRIYLITSVPPSPSLDEVSIGYNAYSILHTGRDEYGYFLPILLRAYDDWRPAGYVYFVVPFVGMFGLSTLAVRLPSVILSLITILCSYFLTQELFFTNKYKKTIGLFAAFLFAISPWNIYISRLGHEVNLGLAVVVLATLFFIMSMNRKKAWLLILSCILLGLSFYTYQSEKVFVPLLVILLSCCFIKTILTMKKTYVFGGIIGILIALPMLIASFSPTGMMRWQATSIFSNPSAYQQSAKQLLVDKKQGNIVGEIIDNRRFVPLTLFLHNYVLHFNPEWLFGNSGQESFKAPNVGLFYPWISVLLVIGLILVVFSSTIPKNIKVFIIGWILISFVASAITTQAPQAMRSFNLLPMPQIISAFAIVTILAFLFNKNKILSFLFVGIIIVCSIWSMTTFYREYFLIFPKEQSQSFQYALQQAVKFVINQDKTKNIVIISNVNNLYQSYMFYLFAKQYDPHTYLKNGGTKTGGFAETHHIDNIDFKPIVWKKDKNIPHVLLVGNPDDFPGSVNPFYKGYYLDGTEGVWVVAP